MSRDALAALVSEAAALTAAKLAEATREKWRVDSVAFGVEDGAAFEPLLASIAKDHYGSRFTVPGAAFVVIFGGKSGYLASTAFTRDHQDQLESLEKRELRTLAELANVILNPLVGRFAEGWKRPLILSSPEMRVASPRELITSALGRFEAEEKLAATALIKLSSPDLFSDCAIAVFLGEAALGGG